MSISRRDFLKGFMTVGGGVLFSSDVRLWAFDPEDFANPLASYPNRGWERIYRAKSEVLRHIAAFGVNFV
mgnify:CR=1 FL=1